MDHTFHTHIKKLQEAINHNKLIVFAGAGVSMDAGIPSWNQLKSELKSDLNIDDSESDALKIAQLYYNERDEKEYLERVREILKYQQTTYLPIHELILQLRPAHIITTNFDDLFEQVINEKLYPYSPIIKDIDFPYALNTNLLVKVHGDLNEGNIILKEDDFLRYSRNHPLFDSFIKSQFASKVVLFIGYSFSDPDLQAIIQHVREILGNNYQYAYLLDVSDKIPSSQRDYLKKKGIHLISYKENDEIILHHAIKKDYTSSRLKSEPGKKTAIFLSFLRNYNAEMAALQDKNIIDKLYTSLYHYDDLDTLSGNFIANLYPFKSHNSHFKDNIIYNVNSDVFNLYKNSVKLHDDGRIEIIDFQKLKIPNKDVSSYEEKLRYITRKMLLSGVVWLCDNFGATEQENYINITKTIDTCDCYTCQYLNFRFDLVANTLTDTDNNLDIKGKILYGYLAYQVGDWEKALTTFSKIATEAWKSKRLLLYFLCKSNIKKLHNLISMDYTINNENKRNQLIEETKKIDLDQLLSQLLSDLRSDEYRLLKYILKNDYLSNAQNEITKNHLEIIEKYHHIKNDGVSMIMGKSPVSNLQDDFFELFSFYWNNNLVLDAYSNFKDFASKTFEGVIVSYATNESYNGRLKEFSYNILKLMALYANPNKLQDALNKYNVDKLALENSAVLPFIVAAKNFFKSFPYKNPYAGYQIKDSLKDLLKFTVFEKKCSDYFSNFLLILGHVETSYIDQELINDIMLFIEIQDFLSWQQYEILCQFLRSHSTLFDDAIFSRLIKIFSKIQMSRTQSKFLWSLYAIKNQNKSKIDVLSAFNFDSFIAKESREYNHQEAIAALYFLAKTSHKSKIRNRLYALAKRNPDINYYEHFVNIGALKLDIQFYASKIHLSYNLDNPESEKYPFKNNKIIHVAGNSLNFIISRKLQSNPIIKKKIENSPSWIKFALIPELYDYLDFELDWIKHYEYSLPVLNHLAKSKKFKAVIEKRKSEIVDDKLRSIYFSILMR